MSILIKDKRHPPARIHYREDWWYFTGLRGTHHRTACGQYECDGETVWAFYDGEVIKTWEPLSTGSE